MPSVEMVVDSSITAATEPIPSPAGSSCCAWPIFCASTLLTSMLIDAVLLTVLVPLTPQLKELFDITDGLVGLLFSAKGIVQIVTSPITAKVVNRTGPRIVICTGLVVLVGSTAVYALGADRSNFSLAITARAVQGIASSCILVGGQCLVTSVASGDEGSLLGLATLGSAAGVLLGPTVGGWLASPYVAGLHGMFWVLTGVATCVLLLHVLVLYVALPAHIKEMLDRHINEPSSEENVRASSFTGSNIANISASSFTGSFRSVTHDDARSLNDSLANRGDPPAEIAAFGTQMMGMRKILRKFTVWRILIGVFAYSFTIAMLEPVAPTLAVDELDIDPKATSTLGFMWAAAPLGFVLFTPASGILADKCPKNILMSSGLLVMVIGLALLRSCSTSFGGVPLFEVALALVGFGAALEEVPSQAAMAAAVGKRGQAAGFASIDMAMNLGFVAGPLVGAAVGLNPEAAGVLIIVLVVCLGLGSVVLGFKRFEDMEDVQA